MFHMANDSGLFRTRDELERDGQQMVGGRFDGSRGVYMPLFEAKMVHNFNHRFGDFALLPPGAREHILPQVPDGKLADPAYTTLPRYWVSKAEVEARLSDLQAPGWLLGWRDVTDPRSSARTVVSCVIPRSAVSGQFPLLVSSRRDLWLLYANLCSFALDYASRQKIGGAHLLTFHMKQLPLLSPEVYDEEAPWSPGLSLREWLLPRVLELTYTSWDLSAFAEDLGWSGPPFAWDPQRRLQLRCELDAAFFHLYGIGRDDVAYVMDTFPIVKRRDEAQYGEFRTKNAILAAFDRLRDVEDCTWSESSAALEKKEV